MATDKGLEDVPEGELLPIVLFAFDAAPCARLRMRPQILEAAILLRQLGRRADARSITSFMETLLT